MPANQQNVGQDAPAASARDSDRRWDNVAVMTVGLVASPELGERIAQHVSPDLPGVLADQVDDQVSWKVATVTDPLTGSNLPAPDLLHEVSRRSKAEGWNYAVCLTDLPIWRDERVNVASASVDCQCGWVSLPALGVVRLHSHVRTAIVQLMREMHWRSSRYEAQHHGERRDPGGFRLAGRGIGQRVACSGDDTGADVRYAAPRLWGALRLLAGMVHANTPWTLFPSFKSTIAAAFATGAYGLIFSTLWKLGDTYEVWRLAALMIVAMGILIAWIIIAHELWEMHSEKQSSYLTMLYNTATVLTIATAVVFAYVAIFVLILLAGLVFIPDSMLEKTLQHSTNPVNYLSIAWVTASVATVAGAVGASLEDSEKVRAATFGWRQRSRFEEHQAREEEESG